MIPTEGEYDTKLIRTTYRDGRLVSKYRVLVPDSTISGDYRHEYVEVEFHGAFTER